MDKNILKKINILRGVKKNHNMGKYPDEIIHHICEALWNVNKKHMLKDNHTECKLKERTNHIAHYLEKLNRRKYPIFFIKLFLFPGGPKKVFRLSWDPQTL